MVSFVTFRCTYCGSILSTEDSEHVPGIEQKIRVIKERVRVIWDTHPYTILPSRMISKMVYY